jgi:hypothetical protein
MVSQDRIYIYSELLYAIGFVNWLKYPNNDHKLKIKLNVSENDIKNEPKDLYGSNLILYCNS